jgi:hypothetical protein
MTHNARMPSSVMLRLVVPVTFQNMEFFGVSAVKTSNLAHAIRLLMFSIQFYSLYFMTYLSLLFYLTHESKYCFNLPTIISTVISAGFRQRSSMSTRSTVSPLLAGDREHFAANHNYPPREIIIKRHAAFAHSKALFQLPGIEVRLPR